MKPIPLVEGAFFVSSTFLDTISLCSRMSELYKLEARVLDEPSPGLVFGGHLHTAIELHYRSQEFHLGQEEISQRVSLQLAKEFEKRPVSCDFRTLNWASELYNRYVEKYQFEDLELLLLEKPRPCKYCS